jgi:hypothetical protein
VETPDLFAAFVRPLHQAGLKYMVSGSLASMQYGEPRLTMDVDLVVHLDEPQITRFAELFPKPHYYTPPAEVIGVEIRRTVRGHFNVIHLTTGLKADFYPSTSHPYWQWAWDHRRSTDVDDQPVYFAPPEYVILWKLQFFREGGGDKHLRDIRGMIAVSAGEIDLALLDRATAELGLVDCWQQARGR